MPWKRKQLKKIDTCCKTLSYTICEGLEGQPLHKKYMRTNLSQADRGDYDGYTFIVCGSFFDQNNPKPDEPLGSKGGILFVTTSEDYDRYLQESIYYQQLQESTDMSSIYLRDNVFSNIKGGRKMGTSPSFSSSAWSSKTTYRFF